jgi:lipopolysaccharide/colanic/teichoic acid biosynthesis glycosyltransferase
VNYSKRIFDIVIAVLLSIFFIPFLMVISLIILIVDGGPIFYASERSRDISNSFNLIKFRTMKSSAANTGVSGGDKSSRITTTGRFLRRTRIDELPQLWNVLKGDLSFVGPRPPLKEYVDRFPALYQKVLLSRPGITGLASLVYHRHEERLLAQAKSAVETDQIYCKVCIPKKAKLDLIYQANRSLCWDTIIMIRTAGRLFDFSHANRI